MSWQRAELSALALAGLLLKLGLSDRDPFKLGATAMMCLVSILLWIGRGARRHDQRAIMGPCLLRSVSAAVVLTAALVGATILRSV